MNNKIIGILCYLFFSSMVYGQQKLKENTMEQTNLKEQRKEQVHTYFEKVQTGAFDESYFNLFTDDVELYYPKFGFEKGKEGIRNLGKVIGKHLQRLSFDTAKFNYHMSDKAIIVEGVENGRTQTGEEWPDGTIAFGKFSSVFEFEGNLIKRMHVYVDPDFTSADSERVASFRNIYKPAEETYVPSTREVIDNLYAVQFGKKEGALSDFFAEQVDWDLPGNVNKFPWVGKRHTKVEIEGFFKALHENVASEKFEIDFIAVQGENATVVGNLASKILKYDKVFETEFVVIIKVVAGKIVKYHFLEDSYKLDKEMH